MLQGSLGAFLKRKGALERIAAVRLALDIARFFIIIIFNFPSMQTPPHKTHVYFFMEFIIILDIQSVANGDNCSIGCLYISY